MLFPDNPTISTFVIQVTIWFVPLLGLTQGLGYALNAAQCERRDTARLMVTTGIALICTPILIWQFGVLGACLSLLLRQGLTAVARLSLLRTISMRREGRPAVFKEK